MDKRYLYLVVGVLVVVLIVLWKKKIDATNGGFLEGNSHKNGGIKGRIKGNIGQILVEGGEVILDVNSMEIKDRYICEGTPIDIASALNELGGSGAKFGNGKCVKII